MQQDLGTSGEAGHELSPEERLKMEEVRRPGALVIHEAIRKDGEKELARPTSSLFWSGLACGIGMTLTLIGDGLIRSALPDSEWRPLLTSLGYTLGFLVVIIGRQQLFTENTITAVLPWFTQPSGGRLAQVAKLWTVVLLANILGTLLFTGIMAYTDMFDPAARAAFAEIGKEASEPGFGSTFIKAVAAGWMVALIAWLITGSPTSRVLIVFIITYFIGLADLAHVIAGSAEVAFPAWRGEISWSDWLGYVFPALLGNVVGGVLLTAALNHLQVKREVHADQENGSRCAS